MSAFRYIYTAIMPTSASYCSPLSNIFFLNATFLLIYRVHYARSLMQDTWRGTLGAVRSRPFQPSPPLDSTCEQHVPPRSAGLWSGDPSPASARRLVWARCPGPWCARRTGRPWRGGPSVPAPRARRRVPSRRHTPSVRPVPPGHVNVRPSPHDRAPVPPHTIFSCLFHKKIIKNIKSDEYSLALKTPNILMNVTLPF